MRNLILFVVLAAVVGLVAVPSLSRTAGTKHRATIRLVDPVLLQDKLLDRGEYLFVHDDAAMARGEACSFVYKGGGEVREKLVASFHCMPEQRAKANHFVVRTAINNSGVAVLKEYQFRGETEAHVVSMP